MAKQNNSSTFVACLAVGLVAVIAITALAINGWGKKDPVTESSSIDTVSLPSSSSEEAPSSVPSSSEETPSSSKAESSSSLVSSTTSSNNSSSTSSGKRPANYPANDGDKVCYLTFDDGPSTAVTTRILETLDKYNVKATFFVANGSKSMLTKINDGGHAIGLHTNTHDYDIYKSKEAYFKDLNAISDKVYEAVGIRSKIIRFPGGSSNTVSKSRCPGIMSVLVEEVERQGYAYFDWNVDSNDANASKMQVIDGKKRTPKATIVSSVLNSAKGKDKICVLMHDIAVKTTTADALPEIIEGLRDMGYRFEALTTSSPVFHMKVNN